MQDAPKAVWSIPYVSVAFFPSLKQNVIAYRSSKVSSRPDCIFEIHQLWQSGFSRVYSNCCCSSSFEAEIIKNGQSSHKMYSNNILNFQESTTILNAGSKKYGNLLNAPRIYIYIKYIFISLRVFVCACMCMNTYIHMYLQMYIYAYVWIYELIYTYIYICLCGCVYMNVCMFLYWHIYVSICEYVHVYVSICVNICVCDCEDVYLWVWTYV